MWIMELNAPIVSTDYRYPVHGGLGCCTAETVFTNFEPVKRCCCGSRMIRWGKSLSWICPRCGPKCESDHGEGE